MSIAQSMKEEGMFGKKQIYEQDNWKIVRNRVCIRALLIFLGIILMQVFAYMVCVGGTMLYGLITNQRTTALLENLMQANTDNGTFMILISAVSALLSGIWCGVLYIRSDWREHPFSYRKAFSVKNVLAIAGAGAGGCVVLTFLLTGLAVVIPQAFSSYNHVMNQLTDKDIWLTVLYVLLIGPISEELIFRGAILDRFYLAFPFIAANLLQAALFGIYHMNIVQGLYAFLLGFLLGMIRYVTGSILASMMAHILFNATSYGLDFIFPTGQDMNLFLAAILLLIGLSVCVFSLRYLWKMVCIKKEDEK